VAPSFFAEDVQRRLMAEAIRFCPITPRSPHLNGKVERVQRTVLEEFWPTVDVKAPEMSMNGTSILRAYDSVGEARASLSRYLDFFNRKRPTLEP
jgi:transposase InsO family protein